VGHRRTARTWTAAVGAATLLVVGAVPAAAQLTDRVGGVGERVGDVVGDTRDAVDRTVEDTTSTVDDLVDDATGTVRDLVDDVTGTVEETLDLDDVEELELDEPEQVDEVDEPEPEPVEDPATAPRDTSALRAWLAEDRRFRADTDTTVVVPGIPGADTAVHVAAADADEAGAVAVVGEPARALGERPAAWVALLVLVAVGAALAGTRLARSNASAGRRDG
jgi:uncharacterized protein YjbJ (UPF0337 family)